ncbi:DUF1731 domain-containing protein, partial [Salmonella sp. 741265128_PSA]
VLGGQRALPKRLEAAGFAFRCHDSLLRVLLVPER